jgi:hypothetical protein
VREVSAAAPVTKHIPSELGHGEPKMKGREGKWVPGLELVSGRVSGVSGLR